MASNQPRESAAIAQPLGKSPGAVTYHRNSARRLGLLRRVS